MKNIGIWLDKDKAYIVKLSNGSEQLETVTSNVEHYHVHGGSGTRLKGGPQDVVQDSRYLEREKHQLRNYFKEIASLISEAKAIAIFGPAETRIKFKKELEEHYRNLNEKVVHFAKADSMTENQIKALIRNYFLS